VRVTSKKIEPCAWCGDEFPCRARTLDGLHSVVKCLSCGARGAEVATPDGAVIVWNTVMRAAQKGMMTRSV